MPTKKKNFSQGKPTRCREILHDRPGFGLGYLSSRASYWSMPLDYLPIVQGLLRASPVFKGEVFFV